VIRVKGEQAQPWPIPPGDGSAAARDAHRVEPLTVWPLAALDQFPTQTLAGLDLLPGHRLQKFECLENSPGFRFVEREQVGLEFGVVEIQLNHVPLRCCSSASKSAALGGSDMASKARSSRADASG